MNCSVWITLQNRVMRNSFMSTWFTLSMAAFALHPTKVWQQMGNFSLRYSHLKLVDHGYMMYFCFLRKNNVTSISVLN